MVKSMMVKTSNTDTIMKTEQLGRHGNGDNGMMVTEVMVQEE